MNDQDPAEMLAAAVKALRWAGFLTVVMLVILVVDLQLKRSVASQAVKASEFYSRAVSMARLTQDAFGGDRGGPAETSRGTAHAGDTGRDGLAGDATLAAGAGEANGAAAGVADPAPAGPRARAPRNGGRASRPDTGS